MTNPVIIALDVESAAEARALVGRIGPEGNFYKVGMELFTAAGMDFVGELIAGGKDVFLDLKLYDIGETVRRTIRRVALTGVRLVTVHAIGQVMRAAVEGRGDSPLKLLGVTVLTSFDSSDVAEEGYPVTLSELVLKRARQGIAAGMDGLVVSPHEARAVRAISRPETILVTPGVRSAGASRGDQKRVATPAEAVRDSADYVVIGRQITRAADPARALQQILAEIQTVAHV